ncbi:uncharacterized protein LOC110687377 [Chenopodium quinoa]|uniref:uncharacterized protein LOC110687377 n=1 Tax=Chenopodium quinoa TaxID=63459 RepID=UPI000B774B14|nr:uncharacterized protein LOC110687377 [Chenopodium quinoa]
MQAECHGIMCRHQFKVFDDNGVKQVPSKYILRLWRKDVHRCHTRVKEAYHDPSKTEEVKRYDRIIVQFESVCLKAASRPEYAKMALDAICKLENTLDAAIQKESVNAAIQKESVNGADSDSATMESSPSVNNDVEGVGTMPPSELGDSCLNSSALGLDDISVDPLVNTPTQAVLVANEVCHNSGSSVDENLACDVLVQKALSVGDPISRKKPHRPRAKCFLSFAEKCAKKALSTRTKTDNVGNCVLTEVEPESNNPPKQKRKR